MINELARMKKEAVMAKFQVLYQNLLRGTEKSHRVPSEIRMTLPESQKRDLLRHLALFHICMKSFLLLQ
jgi:hypothetical protein